MREVTRGESSVGFSLPKVDRDTCVRVVFVATSPVKAKLITKRGWLLSSSSAANQGVLDARGPVCFRREDEPRLVFDGDAGTSRYVVWAAP